MLYKTINSSIVRIDDEKQCIYDCRHLCIKYKLEK